MKIAYSRMAIERKRKYQIITKIVQENGKKSVWKYAACAEAGKHIENTYHNESLLEAVYGEYLLHGKLDDGCFVTPFVEGETLGSRLRESIEERDEETTRALLWQWRKLIAGNPSNICKFTSSEKFEEIFGHADDLTGMEATIVSNLDCSAENIFFTSDHKIKIIDYEWVFEFPIPIELTFYRGVKMFFAGNPGLIDWKTLLKYTEINEEHCQKYERLVDAFANYVYLDKEGQINYALMGEKFKIGKTLKKARDTFQYRFPYNVVPEGTEIILYGAGQVGEEFSRLINLTKYCQIAAWIDKKTDFYSKQGLLVKGISEIKLYRYDYVLIAVYQKHVAEEIRKELIAQGVEEEKIVWEMPQLL